VEAEVHDTRRFADAVRGLVRARHPS
jgi:hypothetical protein